MKKRLLALLTSALCVCTYIGGLPASAADQDFNATEFCIIAETKTDSESDIYRVYRYSAAVDSDGTEKRLPKYPNLGIKSGGITINGEKTSDFVYGDILLINSYAGSSWFDSTEETDFLSNNAEIKLPQFSSKPRMIFIHVQDAQYAGNCRNILETKELTLTKKEFMYYNTDLLEHINFSFMDEDGEEYNYICYYCNSDPEIDVNTCNVGDKILASVYKDVVILPLEVYPDTTEHLPGDVDGNGTVDITDVIRMNRVYVGCQKFTPEQIKAGDVDHDGKISLSDSMLVLRYLVGLDETLGASLS
ncbi:MAG: dockerin type I repeat-containing protein [Oscillospiraceae bacterium]|nr:dockerin type I repeat-containing protein [Oscillospiraceae bacterium]